MLWLSPDPGLIWQKTEVRTKAELRFPGPRLGSLIRPCAPSWVLGMKPSSNLKNKNSARCNSG